ncbi:MAG: hypothetical protein HY823_04050 [Acidobacteria bacterium]|nr:hypothetical protein [Acidobacteriota bacterium]
MTRVSLGILLLAALLACAKEQPRRVQNDNLGIAATFPGEPKLYKHQEPTPFGSMEWFDTAYSPPGRMDESFHVQVGNLPEGTKGGATPAEVAETFAAWLRARLGSLDRRSLPGGGGAGFAYRAAGPGGTRIEGVLVVRRGRLHHAQGTVAPGGEARMRAFIDGFEVR